MGALAGRSASDDNNGCYINFTEESYIDTTLWTFITNGVSAVIYFMMAVKLYFFPHTRLLSSPCKSPTDFLVPVFLAVTSVSHCLAAVHTATAKSAEDLNPIIIASNLYGAVGSSLIFSLALAVLGVTPEYGRNLKQTAWFALLLAFSIAPIWAVIYNFQLLESIDLHMCFSAGYYLLLPLAYAARIFETIEKTFEHYLFTKFFSFVAILVSMSYTHNFYWRCGSYVAYRSCFEECPLPTGMNQTSFFNIAKLLALICWAWAEDQVPSVCMKRLSELEEDDPTVISDGSDDSVGVDKDNEAIGDIECVEEQNYSFKRTRTETTEATVEDLGCDSSNG